MKTKLMVLILLLSSGLFCLSATKLVKAAEAKQILGRNFISLEEARRCFPDLPNNLSIPFSSEILNQFPDYWLIPIESTKTKSGYEYCLVKTNYSFEIIDKETADQVDTLGIDEAKKVIYLLSKLRPGFLGPDKLNDEFKLFFRSKTLSEERPSYRQIFSYSPSKQKFLLIDWPDMVDSGMLNHTFVSFLQTKNDKDYLGIIPLPDSPKVSNEKNITILTLLSVKNQ